MTLAARLHIGKDGLITVMTGKVECGQGARAELTQAAAEELRVDVDRVHLVMADTALVPDDGGPRAAARRRRASRRSARAAPRRATCSRPWRRRRWNVDAGARRGA